MELNGFDPVLRSLGTELNSFDSPLHSLVIELNSFDSLLHSLVLLRNSFDSLPVHFKIGQETCNFQDCALTYRPS